MKQSLSISGIPIKTPTTLGFESYNLTKSGRVVSGDMTMEIINKKRKFTFAYDVISHVQMNNILNLIDDVSIPFFTLSYIDGNEAKSAICYAGSIKKTPARTGSIWYYTSVSFDLIEQ